MAKEHRRKRRKFSEEYKAETVRPIQSVEVLYNRSGRHSALGYMWR
jgi:hypothetical protein